MAASNAIVGALRIVLGADSAALEKGLKEAQGHLAAFSSGIAKTAAAAATAFVAVGGAVALAVKGSINEADKLGKMSEKVGVPVDELSKLKYAADLSDVSLETLSGSLQKLSRNLAQVARGELNDTAMALQAIGVSVTEANGKLRPTAAILADIAAKFAAYKDSAEKTAIAQAIFGKTGAELIPLLNMGKTGLQETAAEAEKLGIVLSKDTAQGAQEFNDNLTRLGKVKDAIILQVTSRMLPALQNLLGVLVDAAKNTQLMKSAADALVVTLKALVTAGVIVGATFQAIGQIVSAVASAVMLVAKGEFSQAYEVIKAGNRDVVETVKSTVGVIGKIWTEAGAESAKNAPSISDQIAAPAIQSASKVRAELGRLASETKKAVAEAMREAKKIFEDTRTPAEEYALAIEKINRLHATGFIDAQTYARAIGEAQRKMVEGNEHAKNLGNALENAFDKVLQGGMKGIDIVKAFVKELAIMEAKSAFKFLLYGDKGSGFGGLITSVFSAGTDVVGRPAAAAASFQGTSAAADERISVNIHPGAREDTATQRRGSRGDTILDIHTKLTDAWVADGSADAAMGGRYFARPVPVAR